MPTPPPALPTSGDEVPSRGVEDGSLILKLVDICAAEAPDAPLAVDADALEAAATAAALLSAGAMGGRALDGGGAGGRPPRSAAFLAGPAGAAGGGAPADPGGRTSSESTPLATACCMADEWLVSVFMMRWWVRWAPGGRLAGSGGRSPVITWWCSSSGRGPE